MYICIWREALYQIFNTLPYKWIIETRPLNELLKFMYPNSLMKKEHLRLSKSLPEFLRHLEGTL